MNLHKINANRGVSLLEVLMSIGIMFILGSVSISVFSQLANSSSIDRDVGIVVSYIEKARNMAVNSENSLEHGILFETHKVSVFKNTSYSLARLEASYDIPNKTKISRINLSRGVTSLYFAKLTGTPSATGTIVMSLSNNSEPRTITIYGTGVIDVQ